MDLGLNGRVAVVTGAGSGVGRAVSRVLCREGAAVAIADIDLDKAAGTVDSLAGLPGKALALRTDVTDWANVVESFERISAELGPVDILINNAGGGIFKNFDATTPEDWMFDLKLNYVGMLHCTRAAIGGMIARRAGSIVSVVSDAARVGEPYLASYAGAKAAVIAFSKSLAKEVGRHGIRVNCLALGTTKTPMIEPFLTPEAEASMVKRYPLGRLGLPEDPASLAAFLVSDLAAWITGQVYSVNGGYTTV